MDAGYHRPMELDIEELESYIDVAWVMTFIDSNDN